MATAFGVIQSINRKTGRTPQAAAAYRAGCRLVDSLTGQVHDFSRKRGVTRSEIVVPEGCGWAKDRQRLWDAAGDADQRKNATTAREWLGALPHELSHIGRVAITDEFARYLVQQHGVAIDWSIHAPDKKPVQGEEARNWHVHMLFTSRRVTPEGMGEKTRELDTRATASEAVEGMRKEWERIVNKYLELEAVDNRIAMQSYARQGVHKVGQPKIGQHATALERVGVETEVVRNIKRLSEYNSNYRVEGRQLVKERGQINKEIEKMRLSKYNTPSNENQDKWADGKPPRVGYAVPADDDPRKPKKKGWKKEYSESDRKAWRTAKLSEHYDTDMAHVAEMVRRHKIEQDAVSLQLNDYTWIKDTKDRIEIYGAVTDDSINAMCDLAEAKGWTKVNVYGDDDFKARAYLEHRLRGIEVLNYEPPKHVQDRLAKLTANGTAEAEPKPKPGTKPGQGGTSDIDAPDAKEAPAPKPRGMKI